MIKFKQSSLCRSDGSYGADIIVTARSPVKIRDAVIGGSLIISGIIYLIVRAFKNGATAYEVAELKALAKIGAIDD